jgi:hypothetical protein
LGLHFPGSKASIIGYTDADWANDTEDRHSIGAFIFFSLSEGGPVSWQLKKQSILATSTLESKYTAFMEAAKEELGLRQLVIDINLNGRGASGDDNLSWAERLCMEILPSKDRTTYSLLDSRSAIDYNTTQFPPTTIFTDSQRVIENVSSAGVTARNKHFEIRLFKSRELQKTGDITFGFKLS